ncbi:MAG: hypothetical protein H0W08_24910 [Acidobacteria bacterium]|nr:hypothetical protein [Acidobacteriota bacterium]
MATRDVRLWPAAAALIIGVVVFHAVVPASFGYRHLTQALPSWAMMAAAGTVGSAAGSVRSDRG